MQERSPLCHDPGMPAQCLSLPPHHSSSDAGTHIGRGTGCPTSRSKLGRRVKPPCFCTSSNYQTLELSCSPASITRVPKTLFRGEKPGPNLTACLSASDSPDIPTLLPGERKRLSMSPCLAEALLANPPPSQGSKPQHNRARWQRHSLFTEDETL